MIDWENLPGWDEDTFWDGIDITEHFWFDNYANDMVVQFATEGPLG